MLAATGNTLDALPVERGQPGGVRLARHVDHRRLDCSLQQSLLVPDDLADLARSPNRSLTFEPKLACPFTLPVLLPRVLGSLKCTADRRLTMSFTRTRPGVVLDHLAVAGVPYPKLPVTLDAAALPLVWQV